MYLTRFITDVLGYDLFKDITKEFQVRERYCDLAIKLNGEVRFLIEAKAMPSVLSDRNIEQAENYASRAGIQWVVLTNAVCWRLYHLTFDTNGIEHDLAFEVNLNPESNLEDAWEQLSLLTRENIVRGALNAFWEQKKTLSPASLVKAIFTEEVLSAIRRELWRKSEVRMDLDDVGNSLRRLFNPEVLTEDIRIRKARKKRKKIVKGDGIAVECDANQEECDESESEDSPTGEPSLDPIEAVQCEAPQSGAPLV